MGIPTDLGNKHEFCFRIPDKLGDERTRNQAMGDRIESMSCKDFDILVKENKK
jgi:hypothetical protein